MINSVKYTMDQCVRCMKCVRNCPTSALSRVGNRIVINDERCIGCGHCIQSCTNQGIVAKGSSLEAIKDYDYTVCMVPGALINHCSSAEEAQELFHAIKMLGFDEVIDISDVTARRMKESYLLADDGDDTYISSFCPVINHLIANRYKVLQETILPINYDAEIAAKQIRKRLSDKNVGIFNLCECEAKLAIAKHPNDGDYEIDHALALVDVFPTIRRNLHTGKEEVNFCLEGLQTSNPLRIIAKDDYLIADGFDKICKVLDMAEFGLLNQFKLLILYPCFNGCIGGHLLWGNSFVMKNNIDSLKEVCNKKESDIPFEEFYTEDFWKTTEDKRSFIERTRFFKDVTAQLERLPGYDCSACGMQTCRLMAEEIVKGNKNEKDCRVLNALKEKENDNS